MTPADRTALREAVAKMTPGPWDVFTETDEYPSGFGPGCAIGSLEWEYENNAAGIVALVNAAPALLDALDRLEAEKAASTERADIRCGALRERAEKAEAELDQAFRDGLAIGEENILVDGYFPLDKEHDELVAAWRERRGKI